MERVQGIGGLFFRARDPGRATWMVNFRVRDLDAMRGQLRAEGATVLADTHVLGGIGRFGWAVDPEGNRFELWGPAPEALARP